MICAKLRMLEPQAKQELEFPSRLDIADTSHCGAKSRKRHGGVSKNAAAANNVAVIEEIKSFATQADAGALAGDFEFLFDEGVQVIDRRAASGISANQNTVRNRPIGIAAVAIVVGTRRDVEWPPGCQSTDGANVDVPG